MNCEINGSKALLHEGEIPGYSSLLVLIPELNFGFVALSNGSRLQPALFAILLNICADMMGFQKQSWSDILYDDYLAHVTKINISIKNEKSAPQKSLKKHCGTFLNKAFDKAEITMIDNELYIDIGNNFKKIKLIFSSEFRFNLDTDYSMLASFYPSTITFSKDNNFFNLEAKIDSGLGDVIEVDSYEFNRI